MLVLIAFAKVPLKPLRQGVSRLARGIINRARVLGNP